MQKKPPTVVISDYFFSHSIEITKKLTEL